MTPNDELMILLSRILRAIRDLKAVSQQLERDREELLRLACQSQDGGRQDG